MTTTTTTTNANTTTPTDVPTREGRFPADRSVESDAVLLIRGTLKRHGVGVIARGESGRKVFGGPMVPGPWAFAFGLATCLHNGPADLKAAERADELARTIEVGDGDLLRIDGLTYRVRIERREWIHLDPVD